MDCQNQCTSKNGKCQNRWIAKIDGLPKSMNCQIHGTPKGRKIPLTLYTQKQCIVERHSQKQCILNREMPKSLDTN